MKLRIAAALIGSAALMAATPASAGPRVVTIKICGSGRTMPVPIDDSPERHGSAACHAPASLPDRAKLKGCRP